MLNFVTVIEDIIFFSACATSPPKKFISKNKRLHKKQKHIFGNKLSVQPQKSTKSDRTKVLAHIIIFSLSVQPHLYAKIQQSSVPRKRSNTSGRTHFEKNIICANKKI